MCRNAVPIRPCRPASLRTLTGKKERLSQPGKGATCALGDNLSPENVLVGSLALFGLGVDQYRSSPISKHFQSPSACLKGATKGPPILCCTRLMRRLQTVAR